MFRDWSVWDNSMGLKFEADEFITILYFSNIKLVKVVFAIKCFIRPQNCIIK